MLKILSDVARFSRELALHPVHLTKDKEGHLPPSALVPFCSYQSNLLGQKILELNQTACDKFEPTILEGQLCYSLDVAKLQIKPTREGKTNGLLLMLYPNPFPLNINGDQRQQQGKFRLYIHTLAPYSAYEPGTYKLSGLKQMTAKKGFIELPVSQTSCLVHNQEECQTQKFLDNIHMKCNCTPWSIASNYYGDEVNNFYPKKL